MSQSPPDNMVVMGRVTVPYGVRGWINVQPDTEFLDGLSGYPCWWIGVEGAWQEYALDQAKIQGDHLIAKLEGIDDRDQAFQLKGKLIGISRSELPEPEENEYYWSDLIGLEVDNTHQVALGKVVDVFATGANDVLVVKGERERLIPFIQQVVQTVDIDGKRMTVDWDAEF